MTKMPTVRRLASDLLKCGQNKVWFDPNELPRFMSTSSRVQVRDLITDGLILKRPNTIHSRWRANKLAAAKAKGRHMGIGKRKGTRNARMPEKTVWITKIRAQRSSLKDMKASGHITREEYDQYYMQAKGNSFKNEKAMGDFVEKKRVEKMRIKELASQAAALKMKK